MIMGRSAPTFVHELQRASDDFGGPESGTRCLHPGRVEYIVAVHKNHTLVPGNDLFPRALADLCRCVSCFPGHPRRIYVVPNNGLDRVDIE